MDAFSVSYDFVEKYVRFSKPEYIQVYLYLRYLAEKDNIVPSAEKLAGDLDLRPEQVSHILEFWVSRGELASGSDGYYFPDATPKSEIAPKPSRHKQQRVTRPSYTMAEIDAVAAKNKAISGLFYQAETVLHKVLTQSDMEMLYSFVDWLGLPVEVITMLLSYAAKKGKTGRRYLETVAIDWAERGINTFEAAEAHVMELEAYDSGEKKIRSVLGIHDRALTPTEKKYFQKWLENPDVTLELLPLAYDRTVAYTGKLSYSYLNSILESWAKAGLTTPQQVQEYDNKPERPKPSAPASKPKKGINNYEDTNPVDYDKLEEQILDMMLDNDTF